MNVKNWLPVICLAMAGFIFVTTELMPIGLLPDIARDLGKTEAYTGLLVTVYAWSVALTSLPLTMAVSRMNRRTLLLILLTGFTLSQWLAAVAHSFSLLLAARLMTSLCHALFWSIAPPLAVKVAPGDGTTKALGLLASITSLAAILGMPIGTIIGQHLGWRATFAIIGLMSLVFMVILYKFLPSTPGRQEHQTERDLMPWRNPILLRVYILTALTVGGHFTAFTYMTPLLAHSGGFSPTAIALLLLTLGAAGILGNLIASRNLDLRPKASLMTSLPLLALCLLTAQAASSSTRRRGAAVSDLGGVNERHDSDVSDHGHKKATVPDVANSLYSAIFNVGIGGGALMGNKIFNAYGVSAVNYGGAVFIIAAFIFAAATLKKS